MNAPVKLVLIYTPVPKALKGVKGLEPTLSKREWFPAYYRPAAIRKLYKGYIVKIADATLNTEFN